MAREGEEVSEQGPQLTPEEWKRAQELLEERAAADADRDWVAEGEQMLEEEEAEQREQNEAMNQWIRSGGRPAEGEDGGEES